MIYQNTWTATAASYGKSGTPAHLTPGYRDVKPTEKTIKLSDGRKVLAGSFAHKKAIRLGLCKG